MVLHREVDVLHLGPGYFFARVAIKLATFVLRQSFASLALHNRSGNPILVVLLIITHFLQAGNTNPSFQHEKFDLPIFSNTFLPSIAFIGIG